MNIVTYLERRQRSQARWAGNQRLASTLSTRQVLLSDILDRRRRLLDGHVVLGFSRCGQLLLSYLNELDVTATQSTYSLHCWRFSGGCLPLQHVSKEPLFRGECVPAELHLLVCQTPPPTHTVVVGCRKTHTDAFRQPCFISVLPSLLSSPHRYSLHFKFDLMPPFPSFIPSLSLKIANSVVLNTGDSIVALQYSLTATSYSDLSPPCSAYSTRLVQMFASSSQHLSHIHSFPSSPSHLLPVDVYMGDQLMADVSYQYEKETVQVCVCQMSLDVEVWLNEELQSELVARGLTYRSLTDYDLQLAEVCASSGCVVLVLVVLLEASPISSISASLSHYSTEMMASWSIHTGTVNSCYMSTLKPSQPPISMSGTRHWNPAAPLALSYRHRFACPLLADMTVRAFSNHTVFSGKSLRCLPHTFLPLSLTLTPSRLVSPAFH